LSVDDIAIALSQFGSDAVVLVKGSRIAATERVVHALIG
jgi:UDP-N-acetylmuramyl pentapeptide synthase